MSDIELVIKLPEALYNNIQNGCSIYPYTLVYEALKNGILLPKGRGRLIDADKLDTRERGNNSQRTMWWNIDYIVRHAPTIIEADKEG